jgi:hypothetical protein
MGQACRVQADSGIRNDPDPTLTRPSRLDAAEDRIDVANVILAEWPAALTRPELGGYGQLRENRLRAQAERHRRGPE